MQMRVPGRVDNSRASLREASLAARRIEAEQGIEICDSERARLKDMPVREGSFREVYTIDDSIAKSETL